MTYLQRNKKKNKGTKIVIGIIIFFLILRIFNIQFFGTVFKNTFNYVLESKIGILAPAKNMLTYFQSNDKLVEQNETLKKTNIDLKLDLLTKQIIDEEFELFKSQFIVSDKEIKPLKVILKPPFMPFDLITVAGDLDEYSIGDLVFYQNILIGSIKDKTGVYATVELFSTPDKVTSTTINGTQFESKGLGGGRYVVEVSKDFEVQEGDAISYPLEKIVLLGVASQIESNEENLFKKVYFNVPVALESISYVTVGI